MRKPVTYRDAIDALWLTYEPKFRALLGSLSESFAVEGWNVLGIDDYSDEEYETTLAVESPNGIYCAVRVTLVESQCREGNLDGVAFSLNLESMCGHVIGGMTPFNYSRELWIAVDNTDAIAERWQHFVNADESECVYLLAEHLASCKGG